MRVALALGLIAACADPSDPCDGVDACVVLQVEIGTGMTFDELELGITISGTQSVVTRDASDIAPPFQIAIEVGPQPVALDVVGVGRAGPMAVGAGAVSIAPSAELATLVLQSVLTCVEGGHYCGNDKLYGNANVLYTCRVGHVPELKEVCANGCTVAPPGQDDFCAD